MKSVALRLLLATLSKIWLLEAAKFATFASSDVKNLVNFYNHSDNRSHKPFSNFPPVYTFL